MLKVCAGKEKYLVETILEKSQIYDPWVNIYKYEYGYRLQSFGADGIKGGEGVNTDIEKFIGLN